MSNLFEFHFLNDQLMNMGSVNSASELQGVLCGRLCCGEVLSDDRWSQVALEFLGLDDVTASEEQLALLSLLLNQTRMHLQDDQYGFQPLLPNDAVSLQQRTQELGSWCEGFLHGLGQSIGAAGLQQGAELPQDVTDALRDMAHISQVSIEEDMELEENEVYWTELVEYVRVAVITVFTQLAATAGERQPPASGDRLH